jgi:hypothetical protein
MNTVYLVWQLPRHPAQVKMLVNAYEDRDAARAKAENIATVQQHAWVQTVPVVPAR